MSLPNLLTRDFSFVNITSLIPVDTVLTVIREICVILGMVFSMKLPEPCPILSHRLQNP